MRWSTLMVSCPARDVIRRATLEVLARTDWGQQPIVCFEDPRWKVPLHRHMMLVRSALEAARLGPGELFLFLEDDVIFNRHLRANLDAWAPLRNIRPGDHFFGSLFDPGVRFRRTDQARRWAEADPLSVFGAQGLIVSRATVEHLVASWGVDRATHADLRLARLASFVCQVLYHRPSLIQHVGVESLWGGRFIEARDFDPNWRAT